jgi:hypothetical protein
MPKAKATPLSETLLPIPKGAAVPAPEPGKRRREVPQDRVSMTFRLRAEHYETLRRAAFDARVSQQALLDEALEKWCLEHRRNGGSTVARLHRSMEG